MSEQALDLRRSAQIVRRHKIVVCAFAGLGVLGGVGWTLHHPPMLSSEALVNVVLLPSEQAVGPTQAGVTDINPGIGTQMVIASSTPVLESARRAIDPSMPLETLQQAVNVTNVANTDILTISAQGKTAAQAETVANAVANSYVATTQNNKVGQVQARVLEPASSASGPPLFSRLPTVVVLGLLIGSLVGATVVLAFNRRDRRLRKRDEIADSIGVPVLASIRVVHPSGAAGWTKLFAGYDPGAVDAWRLRKALQYLGLTGANLNGSQPRALSLEVISLGFDSRALALGPHLAVFAASQGIPTALVIGPQQDVKAVATLRAACAAPSSGSRSSSQLQVMVADYDSETRVPGVALTVLVAVVDAQNPRVADITRTTATVLGISAGAVTAEQVARAAASAAAAGRDITGILVADPDRDDHTTGSLPQLSRPTRRRGPTRMMGTTAGTTR
jgi:capsular polysaccharide biosynthesis protein